VERGGHPRALYDLDGDLPPPERTDTELEGYRGSRPARWGNAAVEQIQHDVYGEILDCAYQWAAHHGEIDEALWEKLCRLIEAAARAWRKPDHGIGNWRGRGGVLRYSAAVGGGAPARGAKMVERLKWPGEAEKWRATADEIRAAILDESWDERLNALTEHLGDGSLDAS